MTRFTSDVVVIGAGVVGLACARALALAGREVLLVEAAATIGTGISSRNSEVIHSGIYYAAGSLKARTCVAGRDALYAYCEERGIGVRRCGKLIVLAPGQDPARLDDLEQSAKANGVDDLVRLDRAAVARLEPALDTDGALLSPSTGIIDSHAYMLALQGDFENAGGLAVFGAPVLDGDVHDGLLLRIGGAEPAEIAARHVVNSAGLAAMGLPARLAGFPAGHLPTPYYAKGNYFSLSGKSPFTRLVYPLPEAAGLGVHATLDLGGRVRFGPDVEWTADPANFDVDPARAEPFYRAIRRYWPGLPDGSLTPAYAGIRPKLGNAAGPIAADFLIQDEHVHGVRGMVNLLGIESPGLTASLALAERVAACVGAG